MMETIKGSINNVHPAFKHMETFRQNLKGIYALVIEALGRAYRF